MFSQGLFIIIIPCLAIVVLICWAWFPFWIFVKAFHVIFGIKKPEDQHEPVRGEENHKRFPVAGFQPAVAQPPVLQQPVVQPTAFDPEYFQQNYSLEVDPREAKRRLVFKNTPEKEVAEARTDWRNSGDEVETQEAGDPGSQGVHRRGGPSQRNLPQPPRQTDENIDNLLRPEPAVNLYRQVHR
ncbi:hypothetical protein VSDG_01702 [Cytospora chrysosperma]|uniref:Uncharacterized protein n=1 Tax=Cytospora chrysosperma TaxID=252740 RepID=A0A423WH86_CYTCH|nr:hypothetical protein VSDG_01702 [Valsa sordida]